MIDYSEDQFRDLPDGGRVGEEIGGIEQKRAAALRLFWLVLIVGLGLTGLAAWWTMSAGQLIARRHRRFDPGNGHDGASGLAAGPGGHGSQAPLPRGPRREKAP